MNAVVDYKEPSTPPFESLVITYDNEREAAEFVEALRNYNGNATDPLYKLRERVSWAFKGESSTFAAKVLGRTVR